jgi:outer membrane protein with beta-barrel domain
MRLQRLLVFSALALLTTALPARADLTAFIGTQSNPSTRMTTGISAGMGVLVVGFEGEYAQAHGDDLCLAATVSNTGECAPSLRTVMGNLLIQTPRGILPRLQLYGTVGGGYFRERFEPIDVQNTGFGTNIGGGAKIDLVGPLRVRLDYRIFKLGSDAVYTTSHRFSVGANIAF